MEDCIFCKIINREIKSEIVYEDEFCVAFNDINPRKRVHILIVPKKHIPRVSDISDDDELLMGHLIKIAKELAVKNSSEHYQLVFNVGKEAGQIIFHVHLHLMGN
ncbi:histidine triad nucleotide-binding protein [Candidatus Peregrinibacteria bacterium]|nr:histidine triad nucleotide-binding protein [Candidatus Peregrinibacteria bacterium]